MALHLPITIDFTSLGEALAKKQRERAVGRGSTRAASRGPLEKVLQRAHDRDFWKENDGAASQVFSRVTEGSDETVTSPRREAIAGKRILEWAAKARKTISTFGFRSR